MNDLKNVTKLLAYLDNAKIILMTGQIKKQNLKKDIGGDHQYLTVLTQTFKMLTYLNIELKVTVNFQRSTQHLSACIS